jgi:hypothetical protein
MLNGVQKGLNLQLHGWSLGLFCSIDLNTDCPNPRPAFFNPLPSEIFALPFCGGWEDKALQECNLSAQPPVDCENRIPSGPGQRLGPDSNLWDALASHGQSEKLIPFPAVRPLFFMRNYPQILLQTRTF